VPPRLLPIHHGGQLEGDVLVCTCHWAKFDLKTGTSLVPELTTEPLTPAKYR